MQTRLLNVGLLTALKEGCEMPAPSPKPSRTPPTPTKTHQDLLNVCKRVRGMTDAARNYGGIDTMLSREVIDQERDAVHARLDSVALRQIDLTDQMRTRLSDPEFIQGLLGDKRLNEKQRRFLGHFIDKILNSNSRTGFAKYPTGVGKTWMIALLLAAAENPGRNFRSLVFSPRTNVNNQNAAVIRTFLKETERNPKVGKADAGLQVGIGTYNLGARLGDGDIERDLGNYDLIILDEVHRSMGKGFFEFLRKKYPNAIIIGVSATPYIGSLDSEASKSARQFFETIIDEVSLPEACSDGDITPIRVVRLGIKGEGFDGKENNDSTLNSKADKAKRTAMAVKIAGMIPAGERGMFFCAGVEHAKEVTAALAASGFTNVCVHSKMPTGEKKEAWKRLYSRRDQFSTNSDMLIEGHDDTTVQHAIILRLTKSLWLYEQMIGRACRLDPNNPKKVATVWDVVGQHSGQCTLHGLAQMYKVLSEKPINGAILMPRKEKKPKGEGDEEPEDTDDVLPEWMSGLPSMGEFSEVIEVDSIDKAVIPLDEEYFLNEEYVRADLEAFRVAAGVAEVGLLFDERKDCPAMPCQPASLQNGSTGVYLNEYLIAFRQGRPGYNRELWYELLESLGIELSESSKNRRCLEARLTDKNNFTADIEAYAAKEGYPSPEYINPEEAKSSTITVGAVSISLEEYLEIAQGVKWLDELSKRSGMFYICKNFLNDLLRSSCGKKLICMLPDHEYFSRRDILAWDWKKVEAAGLAGQPYRDIKSVQLAFGKREMSIAAYCKNIKDEHYPVGDSNQAGDIGWTLWPHLIARPELTGTDIIRRINEGTLSRAPISEAEKAEAEVKSAIQQRKDGVYTTMSWIAEQRNVPAEKANLLKTLLGAAAMHYGAMETTTNAAGGKTRTINRETLLTGVAQSTNDEVNTTEVGTINLDKEITDPTERDLLMYLAFALGIRLRQLTNIPGRYAESLLTYFFRNGHLDEPGRNIPSLIYNKALTERERLRTATEGRK